MTKFLRRFTPTQLIALGFLCVILIGGLLLMLPISSKTRTMTSPIDCFFTSTSATCVTGLIVTDTYTHWSLFGQILILLMIQIGGLGIMTIMAILAMLMRHKIGLYERTLLMQSAGFMTHGAVAQLMKRVVFGTVLFEGVGALLLATRFIPKMGFFTGLWCSVFHSVSAFCNAGFDILGRYGAYSSLASFANDPVVCLTIAALIIVGGIGFLVWGDVYRNRQHIKKYSLHTKIVLATTAVLLTLGTVLFLVFERNGTMAGMGAGQRVLSSFFLSTSTRTAGFDNLGMAGLSDSGSLLAIVLMFIGGSPGSTAGGIKTTTIAVLLLDAVASSTRRCNVTIFKRRISDDILKRAIAIAVVYMAACVTATIAICAFETFSLREVSFEVVSAIGTVGLSMGITPSLCTASKIILMILMYAGRIGGATLVFILGEKRKVGLTQRPTENILIG